MAHHAAHPRGPCPHRARCAAPGAGLSEAAFRRALAAEAGGGALPFERVMARAVQHYYASREPFGPSGDFVTAPEISQMMGELVGLWWADVWLRAGRPAPWCWIELGPGRGTLMDDAARALGAALPECLAAARVQLVETSPRLRALQASRLARLGPSFVRALDEVPADHPAFVVAHEFFDALPVRLWDRVDGAWHEREVALAGDRPRWRSGRSARPGEVPPALDDAPDGAVTETSPARAALAGRMAAHLAACGGAALILDYGHAGPALGQTVQALHGGAFADPLATLGEADLSAHVDFGALARAARPRVAVHGPADQGAFLMALGLRERAERLKAGRSAAERAAVEAAVARLAGAGAMGRLFQAMALVARGWPRPAGLA